jgi:hypothetical protein
MYCKYIRIGGCVLWGSICVHRMHIKPRTRYVSVGCVCVYIFIHSYACMHPTHTHTHTHPLSLSHTHTTTRTKTPTHSLPLSPQTQKHTGASVAILTALLVNITLVPALLFTLGPSLLRLHDWLGAKWWGAYTR